MIDKVIMTIEKYKMISKGDSIIVGLSGGPDSVCLLHVLNSLKETYDIKIFSVHLNHMIRGIEAQRDEISAIKFSESLGIPCFSRKIRVEEYAAENKMTSEEAGRFLRYKLFDEILKSVGGNKIALAHNMNDQAETVIMHFLRGSGITGLGGIKPVRDDKYIRPLIFCGRDEIENYCKENTLEPVIDSTNKEEIYLRNKIRLNLIPHLKEKFNPNIIETLSKSSDIFRDDDEYLTMMTLIEQRNISKNSRELYVDKFNKLHICIKKRIIRNMIINVKGNLNGIEITHIEDCIEIVKKGQTGKKISLPDNIECTIQYEVFIIDKMKSIKDFEYDIVIPGDTLVEEANTIMKTKIIDKNQYEVNQSHYKKCFDYDKIKGKLKIRNRKDGDYIYPSGMTGKKKLKEYFIDKKISREERNYMPLIALGSEILWIPGLRDTKNYKIDENTKNIIEITIERGE